MTIADLARRAEKTLRENSPAILTAIGVSGTITTSYLAAKASFEAAKIIQAKEAHTGTLTDPKERIKDRTKLVWKLYIPSGISGAITIGCIISANRIGTRRTAALTAAYSLSEKAFSEYKEKIVEKIGERKEQDFRDELAKDKISKNPPKDILVIGTGKVLCCELFTGRYFESDMETLRKAQNDINAKLMREDYASLSDFYYLIHLPYTSYSSDIGWHTPSLMGMKFSTVLTDDGRPCLAFDYNYTKPL